MANDIRHRLRQHYQPQTVGVASYNFLRLIIFPVDWFVGLFDGKEGTVLCLGCGYGVVETAVAICNRRLRIVASDLVADRVAAARAMVHNVPNITFGVIDVTGLEPRGQFDHIIFADLLHHLRLGEQEKLLDRLWVVLQPGGTLVMKDVDTHPRWKYYWNYIHDALMAGQPLTYHSSRYYQDYWLAKGASVIKSVPTDFHSPYSHYALIVTKPKGKV